MNTTPSTDVSEESHLGFWHTISLRLGLDHLSYSLPAHAQSILYMLGGLIFTTFMVLFISGMYLAQFYNPDQLSSYQSVLYLITQVPFGNFTRSVHYWASNAVFALLIAHITRVFITGSYKRPREGTWLMGVGLLILAILFLFAGTILALGQEGIRALEHLSEIGVILGPFGLWFTNGFSMSLPLIGRIYVAHMMILPLAFIVLIVAHFYLIHIHNLSPKATKDAVVGYDDSEGTIPFSSHVRKLAGWSFILIAILALLALLFPESLGYAGAAGSPLNAVKPRWMFLWIFGMEDVLGIKALVWAPAVFLIALAIVPFIDRSKYLHWRKRPWMMVYGAVMALILIAFSIQSVFASPTKVSQGNVGLSFIEYVLPGNIAYARTPTTITSGDTVNLHKLVFLSFTPTTITSGGTVNFRVDGLLQSGDYNLYLDGPQKKIYLGSTTVLVNGDSFDVNLTIPSGTPGALYSVEVQNTAQGVTFYAPLQLAVEPISMPTQENYPNDTQYPIPSGEIPWIVASILLSAGIGIYLLSRKDHIVSSESASDT